MEIRGETESSDIPHRNLRVVDTTDGIYNVARKMDATKATSPPTPIAICIIAINSHNRRRRPHIVVAMIVMLVVVFVVVVVVVVVIAVGTMLARRAR